MRVLRTGSLQDFDYYRVGEVLGGSLLQVLLMGVDRVGVGQRYLEGRLKALHKGVMWML